MSDDCYWMSGGRCYFEHLLENGHEGLIFDIIREVPKARNDMLDEEACSGCDFPERFIEEAKDPSPPLPREVSRERFQNREWSRTAPPNKQRATGGRASSGPVISNEDLRERESYRKKVRGDD